MIKFAISAGLLFLTGILYVSSFGNVGTDAGYVGYTWQGAIFDQYKFSGLQTGKTSSGYEYDPRVINISTTPYASDELFNSGSNDKGGWDESVVAKDKLRVEFSAHLNWQVPQDRVKEYVDNWAQVDIGNTPDQIAQNTYRNVLRPVVRTIIREEVEKYEGLELGMHQADIAKRVQERVDEYITTNKLPFVILSIQVGTIQPPKELLDEIAKTQGLSNKPAQLDKQILNHRELKQARIAQANGIAAGMKALGDKLTPEYNLYEMTKVIEGMSDAPNHQIIFLPKDFVPTVPMGGAKQN